MSVLADVKSRLSGLVRSGEDRYSGAAPQPLGGYLTTMSVYGALVGTLAGVARLTGREIPDGIATRDVVLHAVATHKLSRLLA